MLIGFLEVVMRAHVMVLAMSVGVGWATAAAGQTAEAPARETTVTVVTGTAIPRLTSGQRVWLTMADGTELRGVATSPTSLEVGVSGPKISIQFGDVRTIEAPDPVRDGAIKGAIIGGLGMGIPFGILGAALHHNEGTNYSGMVIGMTALGIGGGALIGVLIDSLQGRQVVYSSRAKTTTVVISPMVSGRGAGVGGVIRW